MFWREKANLWTLITPPTVWALHFLFCYVVAAIACAKFGRAADLDGTRIVIAVATVAAAGLIVVAAVTARHHWSIGSELPPYDEPTSQDRERFLGVSTFLVSCLSFVGVIFVAMPALFISDCR
ncbi:hypothetical protein [Geminicoccus roseus]|uniref:hypothetical protein n=1 Tax=Geminicoccus roseus TaxID=404900 RepID=UPI000427AA74|nr:hypothetical protein [Geminicoccus roseus]